MTEQRRASVYVADAWWFPVVAILFTLAILGSTILYGRHYLQRQIREQIAGRDAQVLRALWMVQVGAATDEEIGLLNESPADYFVAVLETTRLGQLKELRAARLFSSSGEIVITVPPLVGDDVLPAADFEALKRLKPVSRFRAKADWNEVLGFPPELGFAEESPGPLLEVIFPIQAPGDPNFMGAVQFLLDGSSLAQEFAALSRSLWIQAALAFVIAGGIAVLGLGTAFRRLQRMNRLLSERTHRLLEANQELALAAKTSAVGAVTSHLIHGLKNPLSGLQSFISTRSGARPGDSDEEWEQAISTARRMQNLVSEIVRVLREENGAAQYEVTLDELIQMVAAKTRPAAEQAGVRFITRLSADGILSNRNANLIVLIVDNLIQNAIQATPKGKSITVQIQSFGEDILCDVQDEGPGLPESYRDQLFKPCKTTKEKGTGIGLAISKQLANYLGAELELKSSSANGCIFSLRLPKTVFNMAA